jgi:hypothetical protein
MNTHRIVRRRTMIAARAVALVLAAGAAPSAYPREQVAAGASPPAPQSPDELVNAPGHERAMQCAACHSLDYIRMNSRFLDLAGWTAVVNKMINVYGAPIAKTDVDAIALYLTEHYGKP